MQKQSVAGEKWNLFISRAVAEDYVGRGVFPELRPEHGRKWNRGSGHLHEVRRALACRMLDDLRERRAVVLPRGVGVSYAALEKDIAHSFGLRGDYDRAPNSDELDAEQPIVAALFQRIGIPTPSAAGCD